MDRVTAVVVAALLFLIVACSSPLPQSNPASVIQVPSRHLETGAAVGISLGLLQVSLDHNGTIKVSVVAATPRIPTPLGSFSVFVEGWVAFPERKTLTIATANESWVYDLNGEPFRVELQNVNATIIGEQGNVLVLVEDARANLSQEPHFEVVLINATDAINQIDPVRAPRIAFQSNRSGKFEIYIMDLDGRNQTQLTFNGGDNQYPSVSPDGRQIAFQSNRQGNWEIYVMDIDGRNERRLTFHDNQDRLPDWSPDGRQIVFTSNRAGAYNIFIMDADGANQRQITNTPLNEGRVNWSVDNLLVFNAGVTDGRSWEIYVTDIAGQNRRQLTNNRSPDWSAVWSPDGRRILYISDTRNNNDPGIMVANADGSDAYLLYDSPDYEWGASWSADGRHIIFTVLRNDINLIYVMDADGRDVRLITERGSYPAWVP